MNLLQGVVTVLIVIVLVGVVLVGGRFYTNVTTGITEHVMRNGDTCYLSTSSDGVALSCLPKREEPKS